MFRDQALVSIVFHLVERGHTAEARAVADDIVEAGRRGAAFRTVALRLAKEGRAVAALEAAERIPDPQSRPSAEHSIVFTPARAGKVAETEEIALGHPDPAARATALSRLAEVLIAARALDKARAVARAIPEAGLRSRSLSEVASALALQGKAGEVLSTAQEALAAAAAAGATDDAHASGARLAGALARVGHTVLAASIAARIQGDFWQDQAWAAVVTGLAESGRATEAEAWARSARKVIEAVPQGTGLGDRRSDLLERLIGALASAARRVASGLRVRWERVQALQHILAAMTHRGDTAQALAMAGHALAEAERLPAGSRSSAFSGVVWTFIRPGKLREARLIADSIHDPESRGQALASISEALARTGNVRAAEAAAARIEHPAGADEAMSKVIETLARGGKMREAEEMTRRIRPTASRASRLAWLALFLAAPRGMI